MDYKALRRRYRRRQRGRPPHPRRSRAGRSRRACCRISDPSAGCSAWDAAGADPVLVASADGVGTKLRVAFMTGIHDTIGVDLVNHCVNDILVQGARAALLPRLSGDRTARSRTWPCRSSPASRTAAAQNGCALLGGETAEMPGFYADGEYDVAGFIVGARRARSRRSMAADRRGRRADRPAVVRPAHQRLLARAADRVRVARLGVHDRRAGAWHDGRRGAARAASIVSAARQPAARRRS